VADLAYLSRGAGLRIAMESLKRLVIASITDRKSSWISVVGGDSGWGGLVSESESEIMEVPSLLNSKSRSWSDDAPSP
jgi:hypothetical protein